MLYSLLNKLIKNVSLDFYNCSFIKKKLDGGDLKQKKLMVIMNL
jgi:hypothetical protein